MKEKINIIEKYAYSNDKKEMANFSLSIENKIKAKNKIKELNKLFFNEKPENYYISYLKANQFSNKDTYIIDIEINFKNISINTLKNLINNLKFES